MTLRVDTRGLACPAPVLKTKETIERLNPKEITIIVDNEAAKQNVTRFLGSLGFDVTVKEDKEGIQVMGVLEGEACMPNVPVVEEEGQHTKKTLIMITSDKIGHGDGELGKKLMQNFINTLKEMEGLWRIVFMNSGVKLTISGSNLLSVLKELQDMGVQIFVCGTCLEHFGLLNKKEVGETTNMLDIVTSLQLADKIIQV